MTRFAPPSNVTGHSTLAEFLNRPLRVRDKSIHGRLYLAPMSKLGHVALRRLIAEFGGCGLYFSEMCGQKMVAQGNRNILCGYAWHPEERHRLVCQLFGNDPDILARAAARIEAEGLFGVDLNFGCSVTSICRRNCGAALLKQPMLAEAIVRSVRRAVDIPLFVKFRTGWTDDPHAAVKMARMFEDAGADALTFHPRTAPDRRTRPPRWSYIEMVKAAVSIPVIANGNVFDEHDCARIRSTTGCDAVAIGRMAVARPWIFAQWAQGFVPGLETYPHSVNRLVQLLEAYFDPPTAWKRFTKFCTYFAVNFHFGHQLHSLVAKSRCLEEAHANVLRFLDGHPTVVSRPNISLLR